jgi:hypothetical protein
MNIRDCHYTYKILASDPILRLFNAADTQTACVFLTSLLVVLSNFAKEYISLRHLKQIPYVHQISPEMLRILLKNPL